MMIMLKKLVAALVCLLMITGCFQSSNQPLRLGTNIWPGYEPLYLAQDIGKLPADQVRLVEYPSASEVIRAFRNRALEAASLTLDEVLVLVQDNIPVKIILVHDISNGADTILARPGIDSITDITGKKVAVESNALGAFMISRALALNSLSVEDISIRHLEVNAHEKAYLNREVDVVVNFEPVRTRLLNQGANEIFTSREIYGEIVDVLVVHEDVYRERKDSIQRLVDSWFEALVYLDEDRQPAAAIMARRLNVSPDQVISSFDGLVLPKKQQNKELLGGKQPGLRKTLNLLRKVLQEHDLIAKDTAIPNILTAEFIR